MSPVPYSRKRHHSKRAPLEAKYTPMLKRVLLSSGRPAYYIILVLLIGSLYLVAFLGYSLRTISSKTFGLFIHKVRKVKPKKVKVTKPAFTLPRLTFSKITLPRFSVRIFVLIFTLLILPIFVFWLVVLKDLPSPQTLTTRKIDVSTKIYDRNGILLYKIYKNENRTITHLSDIPPQVRLATLAAEDAEFYEHPGFSIRGIIRSFFRNLEKGEVTGGSTITQQLVKNALLTPEKTLTRKAKEIALSVKVETSFTKDEILEMYLNEVSYGGTAYGIQEASEAYFGKNVKDLTLAEAAYLAGLPKSPSKYSPFSGNFEEGLNRQKDVINLMVINKFITQEDANGALAQKLTFQSNKIDIKAPHFVMYVRSLLAEKYGEEIVETGGLEVITTLDYNIQKLAEEVLKKEINNLKNLHVGNGAVVIEDPRTGEVLAMVGSHDYFDIANDGNVNVTIRPRQPGSSIKVVNYAYALSTSYTPAGIVDDSPITYKIPGQEPYTPKNYEGGYRGKISIRSALAESRNIPAVKVLNSYGVDQMIEMGKKMGITTWDDKSRFGLSLTLGGGEVKLLDLAQVYATISNYGSREDTWSIKKVTNYKGKVLEENDCTPKEKDFSNSLAKIPEAKASEAIISDCKGTEVLDPRVAYLLTDILKDNNARAPTFGRASQLVIPKHPEVAVKTGTSNNLRDNLTVGFTQDYVVAVWVGNNDNTPMSHIASGLTGASTIFNGIMKSLLYEKLSVPWKIPPGLVQAPICAFTGSLPCDGCPTKVEWFLVEKKPLLACKSDQIIAYQKEKEQRESAVYSPQFP